MIVVVGWMDSPQHDCCPRHSLSLRFDYLFWWYPPCLVWITRDIRHYKLHTDLHCCFMYLSALLDFSILTNTLLDSFVAFSLKPLHVYW